MLLKCRVDDRQEFFEFLDRSRESYLNNLIFRDCAMDHERVVASIVALLFLIIAICKAQRFRFLALYFVFERRQRDLTNALLATRIKRLQERRRRRIIRVFCRSLNAENRCFKISVHRFLNEQIHSYSSRNYSCTSQKKKMKITDRELREKLSDMAKNVPKSQKSTERNEMLLKIHDKMSLNKQS